MQDAPPPPPPEWAEGQEWTKDAAAQAEHQCDNRVEMPPRHRTQRRDDEVKRTARGNRIRQKRKCDIFGQVRGHDAGSDDADQQKGRADGFRQQFLQHGADLCVWVALR